MTRKFEKNYRVNDNSAILSSENKFLKDIDLRLDTLENQGEVIALSTQELKDRAIRFLEAEISPKAQELEAKLQEYRTGVSADAVVETSTRTFFSPQKAQTLMENVLSELKSQVEERGNTLAKLLALIDVIRGNVATRGDTLAKLLQLIDDLSQSIPALLRGGVAARGDTLSKLLSLIDVKADATALANALVQTAPTGAVTLPSGTDTQRPSPAVRGMLQLFYVGELHDHSIHF